MTRKGWTTIAAAALLALPVTAAMAQDPAAAPPRHEWGGGFGPGGGPPMGRLADQLGLSDEQRDLLQRFERLADDQTYKADESFFEKLKSAFR